ncbi:Mur ligase family protein [Gulosibacter bifidus]|uniref:UDP-N-acetylmuramyl-tripeptide synthetase n=1 Tax=Gulosibacter bifidus TaxID=272239 RepID=A0ABW5RG60_9MICO|nr:UDP-N-acetylmuramoyl-L-alanyl-D-glutamate--2,6-diaminopimelate ligase [Gulosibacter bifidus]
MSEDSIRPHHPVPRVLSELCAEFGLEAANEADIEGLEVTGVTSSAQRAHAGDVFVAIPGVRRHGAEFTDQAIEAGAVAVATDAAGLAIIERNGLDIPVIVIDDPRYALGHIAGWVYRTDPEAPRLFGATGTNGKTTVTYLIAELVEHLGVSCGMSTTVERLVGQETIASQLTTPESDQLHSLLARMREVGDRVAAIEVSAHTSLGHRLAGMYLDVISFLNFSHDHLDDFRDEEHYFQAKLAMFRPEAARCGVVNIDDDWGRRVVEETRIPVMTVASNPDAGADWWVESWGTDAGVGFSMHGPEDREVHSTIAMPGAFSAMNAACAVLTVMQGGWEPEQIQEALDTAGGFAARVPGRLELVSTDERGPRVYVDYGHTPEAFRSALTALRPLATGELIFVFGADGDRDTLKRPAMGQIAASIADRVIVCDYNPRTEDPASIRATLLEAARSVGKARVEEIADPETALRTAIAQAKPGDVVINAGPGHEDAQHRAEGKVAYSALKTARLALDEAGW